MPWLRGGDEADFLDGPAVRAQLDSPVWLAGAWDRTHTPLVHPPKLAPGLARTAADLGVEILEHTGHVHHHCAHRLGDGQHAGRRRHTGPDRLSAQ